jgi:hypothetical protein
MLCAVVCVERFVSVYVRMLAYIHPDVQTQKQTQTQTQTQKEKQKQTHKRDTASRHAIKHRHKETKHRHTDREGAPLRPKPPDPELLIIFPDRAPVTGREGGRGGGTDGGVGRPFYHTEYTHIQVWLTHHHRQTHRH